METNGLTREQVRAILRASEGIPSQVGDAQIRNGRVSPSPMGHPISSHLHSAGFADDRTKFLSMDDMVEALWLFLRLPAVSAELKEMKAGDRMKHLEAIDRLFGIEAEVPDAQGRPARRKVKFTPEEQRRAGRMTTSCFGVLEVRERAGQLHLQVHTFYPALKERERIGLLESVRKHAPR